MCGRLPSQQWHSTDVVEGNEATHLMNFRRNALLSFLGDFVVVVVNSIIET